MRPQNVEGLVLPMYVSIVTFVAAGHMVIHHSSIYSSTAVSCCRRACSSTDPRLQYSACCAVRSVVKTREARHAAGGAGRGLLLRLMRRFFLSLLVLCAVL